MTETKDYIFLPPRASTATIAEVQRQLDSPYYLDWGIPAIDARIFPPVPGTQIGIVARPGHAKTTTMITLAKRWSKLLRMHKDSKGRSPLVAYATWETSVEEFMCVYTAEVSQQSLEAIGRRTANVQRIESALVHSLGNNVVVIGQSSKRELQSKSRMPNLDDIRLCVQSLKADGYEIAVLFVDYLQRIPHPKYNGENDRSSRVSENTEILKDLGVCEGFATVMGVQAARVVDDHPGLKLPTLNDAQWASTIEQTADKLWALTIPSKYLPVGKPFEVGDWRYQVTPSTLVLQSLKQRWGPHEKGDIWVLDCDLSQASLTQQAIIGEAEPYK